jgi:hypothetical protein
MIPTETQLLEMFAAYNAQIWPMQYLAYLLGLVGLWMAIKPGRLSDRLIPAILGFFWIWVALMFWLPSGGQGFVLGYIFAGIFLLQGLLMLIQALRPRLVFTYKGTPAAWIGITFALYAMLGYPLLGILVGHTYPQAPPFGLTPCPLVAYTFGLLLLTSPRVPKTLLIIPFCYALSGILWVSIGMVEDIGMVLSGLLGLWLIWSRDAKASVTSASETDPGRQEAGWSLNLPDKH